MKIEGKRVQIFLVAMILLLAFSAAGYCQEERKIKMDEYKIQLTEAQKREADANTRIQELEAQIESLKKQIDEVQNKIDATWDEIYSMLDSDKAGYEAYKSNLESIGNQINSLAALSPEDLFRKKDEVGEVEKRIEEAKKNKLSLLTEMENKIADLEGQLSALKAKMPANIFDQYVVVKGDYLWKIAKKDEIYGCPYQWIRIYCVNKDQIKDPDLIFPGQIFNIARGVGENEYLVSKGDFLYKIAGMAKVFNDPSMWTKLYEANKDIISDPDLIYPYQVLSVPKK